MLLGFWSSGATFEACLDEEATEVLTSRALRGEVGGDIFVAFLL